MNNKDSIPIDKIELVNVPRWTVLKYLMGTMAKPNSHISVIRGRMSFVAKWKGMTVGGAFVVTDNLEDNCWQVNAIFGQDNSVYRKMFNFIQDEAFLQNKSVIMYKNKKLNDFMCGMGFRLIKNRMRLECEDVVFSE